jgi:hypothetical protein
MATNWAVISSPRFVRMTHTDRASSQTRSFTSVWNSASS